MQTVKDVLDICIRDILFSNLNNATMKKVCLILTFIRMP